MKVKVLWQLERAARALGLEALGNHLEDVAYCGKGLFERD